MKIRLNGLLDRQDRVYFLCQPSPSFKFPHQLLRTAEEAGIISGHHLLDLFILVKLSLLLGGSILSNAEVKYT